jgi:hypothetical protein
MTDRVNSVFLKVAKDAHASEYEDFDLLLSDEDRDTLIDILYKNRENAPEERPGDLCLSLAQEE